MYRGVFTEVASISFSSILSEALAVVEEDNSSASFAALDEEESADEEAEFEEASKVSTADSSPTLALRLLPLGAGFSSTLMSKLDSFLSSSSSSSSS